MTVEGFLNGDDVSKDRDRLIAEAERPGPKQLLHPYLGEMQVWLVSPGIEISESYADRRTVRITINCVRAPGLGISALGGKKKPRFLANLVAAVDSAATKVNSVQKGLFGDSYQVIDDAADSILAATDRFNALEDAINAPANAYRRGAFRLRIAMAALNESISNLASTPGTYADALQDVIDLVGKSFDSAGNIASQPANLAGTTATGLSAVMAYWGLRRSGADVEVEGLPDSPTATETAVANNRDIIRGLEQRAVLAGWARALVSHDFVTAGEAREQLAAFLSAVDEEMMEFADPTETLEDLDELRNRTYEAVQERISQLPSSRNITIMGGYSSSFELARHHYGDGTRHTQIEQRNRDKFIHPLFVPNGATVEILSS